MEIMEIQLSSLKKNPCPLAWTNDFLYFCLFCFILSLSGERHVALVDMAPHFKRTLGITVDLKQGRSNIDLENTSISVFSSRHSIVIFHELAALFVTWWEGIAQRLSFE